MKNLILLLTFTGSCGKISTDRLGLFIKYTRENTDKTKEATIKMCRGIEKRTEKSQVIFTDTSPEAEIETLT